VKATGFPRKAKKAEVIKENSHLVADPQEVDESGLMNEGLVRVRVLGKDAMKIEGSALVLINGQGHMIKWKSDKLEEYRSSLPNNSKFNRHKDEKEDSDDEGDKKDDSHDGDHDSGFAMFGREQEEEAERTKNMEKAGGSE
jgi:hypothetical protein